MQTTENFNATIRTGRRRVTPRRKRIPSCQCGSPAITGQAYCVTCHAAYMREWRKDNPLNEEQKRKDIARSKVNVYVKRGKLQKTPCPCCGSAEVKARILDYADPLRSVEWLCAASHAYAVRTGALPMIRRAA